MLMQTKHVKQELKNYYHMVTKQTENKEGE